MSPSGDSFWSFRLALTVLVTVLVTIAFVFVTKFSLSIWSSTLDEDPAQSLSPESIEFSLGKHHLSVPANMLAGGNFVAGADSVELEILWPSIEGKTIDNQPLFNERNSNSSVILLRLDNHQEPVGAEERFARILAPAFAGGPLPAPEGLTGRRFQPGTGFSPDILYYGNPTTASRYLAFCSEPFDQLPLSDTAFCQRLIQLDADTRLEIRFRPSLLQDWRAINEKLISLIRGYIAALNPVQ